MRTTRRLFVIGLAAAVIGSMAAVTAQATPGRPGSKGAAARDVILDSALIRADFGPYPTTLVDFQTGRCLDSNWLGWVYTLPCNGGDNQKWLYDSANGQWMDYATGLCLGSDQYGTAYTTGCFDLFFQPDPTTQWEPGFPQLRGNLTGMCLDSNDSGNVYTLPCNGGNYQGWI